MLDHISKDGKENSGEIKAEIKSLRGKLLAQEMLLREKGLPVIVLVEGWAAAGKGSLINDLISEIDPRFYNVVSPVVLPERKSVTPTSISMLRPYLKTGKSCFMIPDGWRGLSANI